MKYFLWFSFGWIFQVQTCFGQLPPVGFAKTFGASGQNTTYDIETLPGGENLIVGIYSANMTLGTTTLNNSGGSDGFVAKMDAAGNFIWAKSLSGPGDDLISAVKLDNQGNIILVGDYESGASFSGNQLTNGGEKDGFLAKLNASGEMVWLKTASNENHAHFFDVGLDESGNIYAWGGFSHSITMGSINLTTSTQQNVLLAKFNPNGEVLWAKTFGGGAQKTAVGISVTPNGESVVTGSFLSAMQIGSSNYTTNGLSDVFIAKYDSEGNPIWSTAFGGTQTDNGFAITCDDEGNIYAGGSFMQSMQVGSQSLTSNGEWDVYVAKFSPTGSLVWANSFGGSLNDRLNGLLVDGQGRVYGMGWFQNTMVVGSQSLVSQGGFDVFVFQLNSSGAPLNSFSFGGTSQDVGSDIGMDGGGNIYLAGSYFSNPMQVGSLTLVPSHATNHFLVKLGNQPTAQNPIFNETHGGLIISNNQVGGLHFHTKIEGELRIFNSKGQILWQQFLKNEEVLEFNQNKGSEVLFYQFLSGSKLIRGKLFIF